MKFLIIVNPYSGKRKNSKVIKKIESLLLKYNVEADVWMWEIKNEIEAVINNAILMNYHGIIAAGGDGTINYIASIVVNTQMPIGIIPLGTGNAINRHFKLPRKIEDSIKVLVNYKCIEVDAGSVNGRIFLGFFGIGLDANVAHSISGKKKSLFKYALTAFREYLNFKAYWYELYNPEIKQQVKPQMLSILNTSQYGHGAIVANNADASDGILDLIIVERLKIYKIFDVIYRVFTGKLDSASYYKRYKINNINVKSKEEIKAQVDGEALMLPPEIEIKIIPNSIKLLVPFLKAEE